MPGSDAKWIEITEHKEIISPEMKRHTFLSNSLGIPGDDLLTPKLLPSEDINSVSDSHLHFHFSQDRRFVTVEIIQSKVKGKSNEPDISIKEIGAETWTLDRLKFGPDAQFKIFYKPTAPNKAIIYRLEVHNCRYGRQKEWSISFNFFLREIDGQNTKKTWKIKAKTKCWRKNWQEDDDFGSTPPLKEFREFINGNATLDKKFTSRGQNDPVKSVMDTVDLIFDTVITIFDWDAGYKISLANDISWNIEPLGSRRDKGLIQSIAQKVDLKNFRFKWAHKSDDDQNLVETDVLDGVESGIVGWGELKDPGEVIILEVPTRSDDETKRQFHFSPSPLAEASAALKTNKTPKITNTQYVSKLYARTIEVSENNKTFLKSEAALDNSWKISYEERPDKAEDSTRIAGPFNMIEGVLKETKKTLLKGRASGLPILNFLEFKGNPQNKSDYRVTSPIGSLVIEGIPARIDDSSKTRSRKPFREIVAPSVYFSNYDRDKDEITWNYWLEITASLRGASLAPKNTCFSQFTFAQTEIVFLYTDKNLETLPGQSFVLLNRKKRKNNIARIDLTRAQLSASRTNDLAKLKFSFKNLLLDVQQDKIQILSHTNQCSVLPDTQINSIDHSQHNDTRALIAVEFPPQHVMEEALPQQKTPAPPDNRGEGTLPKKFSYLIIEWKAGKPEYIKIESSAEDSPSSYSEGSWRLTLDDRDGIEHVLAQMDDLSKRVEMRFEIRKSKISDPDKLFEKFSLIFDDLIKATRRPDIIKIPADQKIYIGPYAMDPDVAIVARQASSKLGPQDIFNSIVNPLIDMVKATEQNIVDNDYGGTAPNSIAEKRAIEAILEQMYPTYLEIRSFYASPERTGPIAVAAELFIRQIQDDFLKNEYIPSLTNNDTNFTGLTEARLSEPSRLVFRVNCYNAVADQRLKIHGDEEIGTKKDKIGRKSLFFDFNDLTNWASMELSVVERSENIYSPGLGGRMDGFGGRKIDLSVRGRLNHLGFVSGPLINANERSANIYNSLLKPPGQFETDIVLPARLSLSPSDSAIFLTPQKVPNRIFLDEKDQAQKTLWSADLYCDGANPGVRAVHSPDLRPDFIFGGPMEEAWKANWPNGSDSDADGFLRLPGGGAPAGGHYAPWFMSREQTTAQHPNSIFIKGRTNARGGSSRLVSYLEEREKIWTYTGGADPDTPHPPS